MSDLDVAVIGNGTIASLIDRDGRHVWTCWPRLDGDPVFHALLGGEGGYWAIEPHYPATVRRRYLGNTAILETEIEDETGAAIRITDFAPRSHRFGRIFRPAMLVRRIEPIRGRLRATVRLRANGRYGAETLRKVPTSNSLRFVGEDQTIRLTTDMSVACIAEELPILVHAPIHMLLGPDESVPAAPSQMVNELLEETLFYWEEWSRYLSIPFEYQEVVLRAAITLKLCAFEETGAVVAALTTSIPEAPGSQRNWDYRFCWLRDTYFTVHALNRLGATRTMEDHLRYITTIVALSEDGTLLPLYPVLPGTDPDERTAPALTGYLGMGPVRIGNAAWFQRQHDVYGSVVMAAAQMFYDHRLPRRGDIELFRLLERLGEQAARLALEPDAGIWEYRGRERVHTHSALMCWVACSRLAKIAGVLELTERGDYWRMHAASIRRAILEQAWDPERRTFVESFGGKDLDAALLLMHEVGFLAADDPRFIGTVEAIEKELRRGNHMFRYAAADDFGAPENAFTVCTFWFVDALAAIGRRDEARQIYEELISCRNSMGILSEDVDPATRELWGNVPQTYSMVGLIVSGMRLSKTWEEAFWRDS
ncbi:MAG TPA: glycoside hydrolase family 15 protein [Geminicoccus sp.]|uniref:glycoside hydrolase family 15 protein n=1 Tax=Geminicoccus sp. TaxID=2024832 RepID=UPI002E2FB3A5|nr:glycoside hydrolase family 15 protein [Geminicoccus sp.]HEX2525497.1 glycoside hydrolase family 15 protein [Geminicoccus sp.]